jgi:hypothetical protein
MALPGVAMMVITAKTRIKTKLTKPIMGNI